MKRKIFFLIVALGVVAALTVAMPRDLVSLLPDADRYYVFCRNYDGETTDNGIAKVAEATDNVRSVLFCAKYVDGVTAVLPSDTDIDELLRKLHATPYGISGFDNITEYCCYSPLVRGGISVDGQTINLQIAVTDTGVYVGTPLLLGAY